LAVEIFVPANEVKNRPHMFRDCALTAAAEQSPEQVALVARVLGHRSLRTGEQHYNHARQLIAHRRCMADLSRMVGDSEPPMP
jgi:integrase